MSREIPRGGQAFPSQKPPEAWGSDEAGMTMRQYYAGQALPGIMASRYFAEHAPKGLAENVAAKAFEIADAMIAHEAKERADGSD